MSPLYKNTPINGTINIHLKKNQKESKPEPSVLGSLTYEIGTYNLSYSGYLLKGKPSGNGVFILPLHNQLEVKYQGVFEEQEVLPGKGFFTLYDPVNNWYYEKLVKMTERQNIIAVFKSNIAAMKK